MAGESQAVDLLPIVVLLGAAVVAVPIFKRIGLGAVLGYLAAGLIIGPFGLGLIKDANTILHVAELGVVMFLFIIGLEMRPSHLWHMRKDIFGLGLTQVLVCMAVLCLVGLSLGFAFAPSLIAGTGFVLTSTAIVMQMLQERGDINKPKGQRIISILLLEDLAIVPLLALVVFLAPGAEEVTLTQRGINVAIGLGAILALIAAGRWLLNPMFRLLSNSHTRELMTAAALLVVLGAALWMQFGGLSAAMGAFLAGVLLSESSYRHQLEADVEPFRGVLLGLFFMAVGMSLDVNVISQNWSLIAISVVAYMVLKSGVIYGVARLFKADHREGLERMVLMAQGGEFAFVLYAAAVAVGLIDAKENAVLTAIIIVSMALTPLLIIAHDRFAARRAHQAINADAKMDTEYDQHGVIIAGFGRFGQIVGRLLLSNGIVSTVMDKDAEHIESMRQFGFKVYYGDAERLDLLEAAGAAKARVLVVAVDDKVSINRIVELAKHHFPNLHTIARAKDVPHMYDLMKLGADVVQRELFDSSIAAGRHALEKLGIGRYEAREMAERFKQSNIQQLNHFAKIRDESERKDFIRTLRQSREELERQLQEEAKQVRAGHEWQDAKARAERE